jgi:hypothetical protein
MKYMLLIHQGTTPLPGTPEWDALSQEEQGKVYAAYQALNQTPGFTPGEQMQGPETATTVRFGRDGEPLLKDGVFLEGKEIVGGYCEVEVSDLDEALAMARGWPGRGTVEIRPVVERG